MDSIKIIDVDGFALTFPAHVIVADYRVTGPGTFRSSGPFTFEVALRESGEIVNAVGIFSDQDNVFRFLGENKIIGDGLQGVTFDPDSLARSLANLAPHLATHVTFDPGPTNRAAHVCEIGRFIEILKADEQQQAP